MPSPSHHVIPISGKDSLCTAIVQRERNPRLQYEYLFCDVGMELPETYAWLKLAEEKLGIAIKRIGQPLIHLINGIGILPGNYYRFCTKMGKIRPMQAHLANCTPVVQYLGFRADEAKRIPSSVDSMNSPGFINKFPLIEAGVDLEGVYRILDREGVHPPEFLWKRLYDDCYDLAGPSSRRFMESCPPWSRAALFSWRSRSNCFLCFFQRLYEWVGLLEHHLDLFEEAERIEHTYGSTKSEFRLERHAGDPSCFFDYHFHEGWPLSRIRLQAEEIYLNRLRQVYSAVVGARHRAIDEGGPELEITSCGAFCGK